MDEFRQRSGRWRLQIQDPDNVVPVAKRRHKVLSDESISACDQDAATVGGSRFDTRLQGYGFHVRTSKGSNPGDEKDYYAGGPFQPPMIRMLSEFNRWAPQPPLASCSAAPGWISSQAAANTVGMTLGQSMRNGVSSSSLRW